MELAPAGSAPRDVLRVGSVGLSRPQAPRDAVGPRDRDRHRRDGRGARRSRSRARPTSSRRSTSSVRTCYGLAGAVDLRRGRDPARPRRARWSAGSARSRRSQPIGTVDGDGLPLRADPAQPRPKRHLDLCRRSVAARRPSAPRSPTASSSTTRSARYPAVVLGSTAARRLGIARAGGGVQVVIGEPRFTVVGILDPVTLVPALDRAALVGFAAARAGSRRRGRRLVALRAQRPGGRRRRPGRARGDRRTRAPRRGRRHAPVRRDRGPGGGRRAPSRRCSSGSAPSRCWSAASGSRT